MTRCPTTMPVSLYGVAVLCGLLALFLSGCATQDSARPNHLPVVQACFLASCTIQAREQLGTGLTGGAGEMQATETTAIPVVAPTLPAKPAGVPK